MLHEVELPPNSANQSLSEAQQSPPGAVSTLRVAPSPKAVSPSHKVELPPDSASKSPREAQSPPMGTAQPLGVASSPPGEAQQPLRKERPLPPGVALSPNKVTPSQSEVPSLPEVWPFLHEEDTSLGPLQGKEQQPPKEAQSPRAAEPPSPQATKRPSKHAKASPSEVQSLPRVESPPEAEAAPSELLPRMAQPPLRVPRAKSLIASGAASLEPLPLSPEEKGPVPEAASATAREKLLQVARQQRETGPRGETRPTRE